MVIDDMVFKPYNYPFPNNGYRCLMELEKGEITIRYKGRNLFTDDEHPYEVRDLDGNVYGYRTADDIFNYLRTKQW